MQELRKSGGQFGLWLWFCGAVLWFLRKISLTQLWVELSWVVANIGIKRPQRREDMYNCVGILGEKICT